MTELANALFEGVNVTSSQLVDPLTAEEPTSPTALIASVFVIGTGGSFTGAAGFVGPPRTGAAVTIVAIDGSDNPQPDVALAPATQLAVVRRWLSLTIKDLADVLRVQRPTIYAWMAERSTPHPDNLERLRQVHRLAGAWRSMANQPLGRFKHAGVAKRDIVELLRCPTSVAATRHDGFALCR